MGFLRYRAKRFKGGRKNICETQTARSCFARRSRLVCPRTRARRRRRNGDAGCGSSQRSAWTRAGTRGYVAETDQGAAFEWSGGHPRGSALDSEVSWRTVLPLGKRSCESSCSWARGNDRDGGAHGNNEAREPADRRRFAAYRRGPLIRRGRGYQRDFVCRFVGIRGAAAGIGE